MRSPVNNIKCSIITIIFLIVFIVYRTGIAAKEVIVDYSIVISPGSQNYGTGTWWSDQHDSTWISRWVELKSKIIRIPIFQSVLEPVNDNDDPNSINWDGFYFDQAIPWSTITVTYNKWITALRDADMMIMPCTFYNAPWNSALDEGMYSAYPAQNVNEYYEFVYVLLYLIVNHLNFPPDRIIFEPINEPDLTRGNDPNVHCFWDNWVMQDLIDVMQAARTAAMAVSPQIKIVGLTECKGTDITDNFMNNFKGSTFLDALSYHCYMNYDFNDAIIRGNHLKTYDLPVYINEYGNFKYYSNGINGALWHSRILPVLWENNICPVEHPISDFPDSDEPYNQMGLFWDWRNEWAVKQAYWVYANFYGHLGDTEIITSSTNASIELISGRKINQNGNEELSIWTTNIETEDYNSVDFHILNFPSSNITVKVYDNLNGNVCIDSFSISGTPLGFNYNIPAKSSHCFVINALVNRPPELAPIGDRSVFEGELLTFTVSATDSDGHSLSYTADNLPLGADFNTGSRVFSWIPDAGQAGVYSGVLFTVTDNGTPPLSDSESITITVGAVNRPPELAPIGGQSVDEGELLTFTVSATDSDGHSLSYTADNLPLGADFDTGSRVFSWIPDAGQAGVYSHVLFTVTDNGTPPLSDSESIIITVGSGQTGIALARFTAVTSRNSVELNWSIVSEEIHLNFMIERTDVYHTRMPNPEKNIFKQIGFVEWEDDSFENKQYYYVDKNLASGFYYYRLKQIDHNGAFQYSGIIEAEVKIPQSPVLYQNHPNPFNNHTVIQYRLPYRDKVTIHIYKLFGKRVRTLVNEVKDAGYFLVQWDGKNENDRDVESGIYICKFQMRDFVQTKKMLLIK